MTVTINVPNSHTVYVDYNVLLDVLKTAIEYPGLADCATSDVQNVAADLFNAVGYPNRAMATGRVNLCFEG